MYDRILFPTDGSEGAAAALDHAVDLAATYGATLYVLSVTETGREALATVQAEVLDELDDDSGEAIDAAVEAASDRGVEVISEVRKGDPYQVINDSTERWDVDVVVMGTHGRRGLDRHLLGSVTEKVVRTSPVPVFTVRAPDD